MLQDSILWCAIFQLQAYVHVQSVNSEQGITVSTLLAQIILSVVTLCRWVPVTGTPLPFHRQAVAVQLRSKRQSNQQARDSVTDNAQWQNDIEDRQLTQSDIPRIVQH